MRNRIVASIAASVVLLLMAGVAFAGVSTPVPEPMSLSLFAGGIGALAVVRYLRKK